MAQLQILTEAAYERLRSQCGGTLFGQYSGDLDCSFLESSDRITLDKSTTGKSVSLIMPVDRHPPSLDATNAQLVYEYIGDIGRVLAAEPRLWASLTHREFWAYTRWRFPISFETGESEVESKVEKRKFDFIHTHWFVKGGGLGSLSRNAVARLWWAAFLTVAPWERDPALGDFSHVDRYYFTKILFSAQQVYQDVMEREFGSNLQLRICFLDALKKNTEDGFSIDRLVRVASKDLLLLLKFRHLPTLPLMELKKECHEVVQRAKAAIS